MSVQTNQKNWNHESEDDDYLGTMWRMVMAYFKVIISIGVGNWIPGLLTVSSWTVLNVKQE
jgi:hypothetical protein